MYNKEREELEAELRVLRSQLEANTSDVGDWKIIKALEYQLTGRTIPYDIDQLNAERQIIRDRINEIELRLIAKSELVVRQDNRIAYQDNINKGVRL